MHLVQNAWQKHSQYKHCCPSLTTVELQQPILVRDRDVVAREDACDQVQALGGVDTNAQTPEEAVIRDGKSVSLLAFLFKGHRRGEVAIALALRVRQGRSDSTWRVRFLHTYGANTMHVLHALSQ